MTAPVEGSPVKKRYWVVVDVEADGPIPPQYSMVCLGAVVVEPPPQRTFYCRTRPVSAIWQPEALAISGFSRELHETFPEPRWEMERFERWLRNLGGRPIFVSDNVAFDWQWVNWYLHNYTNGNPFGWSGRRIGDLWGGFKQDARASWKRLRKTRHDHNPVNDAMGNVEALLEMAKHIKGIL